MTRLVVASASGTLSVVHWPQQDIETHIGAPLTFVGAVNEAQAFAVASRNHVGPINALCVRLPHFFHECARGDVIFLASDAAGNEMDIDVACLGRAIGSVVQEKVET